MQRLLIVRQHKVLCILNVFVTAAKSSFWELNIFFSITEKSRNFRMLSERILL